MNPPTNRDAARGVPRVNHCALSQLVSGALYDGFHHLILEADGCQLQPLETMRLVRGPLLPDFDTILLTLAELDGYWAFLNFSGLGRALLEIRVLDGDVLEFRSLEW